MTSLPYRACLFAAVSALALTAMQPREQFDRRTQNVRVGCRQWSRSPRSPPHQVPHAAIMWRNRPAPAAQKPSACFSCAKKPLFADQRADDVGDIVTVLIKDQRQRTSCAIRPTRQRDRAVAFCRLPDLLGYGAKNSL